MIIYHSLINRNINVDDGSYETTAYIQNKQGKYRYLSKKLTINENPENIKETKLSFLYYRLPPYDLMLDIKVNNKYVLKNYPVNKLKVDKGYKAGINEFKFNPKYLLNGENEIIFFVYSPQNSISKNKSYFALGLDTDSDNKSSFISNDGTNWIPYSQDGFTGELIVKIKYKLTLKGIINKVF